MAAADAIRIDQLGPAELLGGELGDILALWRTTHPEPHGRDDEGILRRHAERVGFRLLAARAADRSLAGFTYGYEGAAGQWWHDIVAGALDDAGRERWLAPGHFELVELHVRPDLQRRGIGGRLHDALLEPVPAPAVLTVLHGNRAAIALYRRRGWRIVVQELRFGAQSPPYHVMGHEPAG